MQDAGTEREVTSMANRMGLSPHSKLVRSAGFRQPQGFPAAVGRAYLLLIDRENPLSSMGGRI